MPDRLSHAHPQPFTRAPRLGLRPGLALGLLVVALTGVACGPSKSGDAPARDGGETGAGGAAGTPSVDNESPANGSQATATSPGPDAVLRHAVFFKFKESSSEADVASVVDAFGQLPAKIDAIKAFQWGTNNSPEGLDDGFTHCFLLTFDHAEGRATYLPHDAHKAFGNVLRPHMEDVFVLDYWGRRDSATGDKQLKHAVFFRFKPDADPAVIRQVELAFAALPEKIDAIKGFEWGTNNSPESHDDGFTHCFMVTFDSEEGRAAYLPHPDHQAFVKLLEPVLDKARVLDFWAQGPAQ